MLQEALRGLLAQVVDDEGVGLDVGYQLLLLLQDVLEVVQVAMWVRLVHELFNKALL